MFCTKIDNLIEESHKVKKYRTTFHQKTKSNKESNPELKDKQ